MQELQSLDLGNNILRFDVIEGVIAGDKKWSETHVYSTGGRGYVGPQGGYVQFPSVHSSVQTRHEIWIKEHGSGHELPISLTDTNVKVREGHEVAIVIADTGKHRYLVQLVNRTAKQVYPLLRNARGFVLEAGNFPPTGFLGTAFITLNIAGVFGIAAKMVSPTIGFGVGATLGFLGIAWAALRVKKFNRKLNHAEAKVFAHFEKLATALK